MRVNRQTSFQKLISLFLVLGLMLGFSGFKAPEASADTTSLIITGDGVTTPITFTLAQLQAMTQVHPYYSVINTYPTKKTTEGIGVRLVDLLNSAGVKTEAKLITVASADGYSQKFTRKELLQDTRYYYPGLKQNAEYDGSIDGSTAGAVPVDTIIALKSAENGGTLSTANSLKLMIGQRWISEQNDPWFVKYVSTITVSTQEPPKWVAPSASPALGAVPSGTLVRLSDPDMDGDKIYYTTDGSAPTYQSNMYNKIAQRWWYNRSDVLDSINKPILVTQAAVIKAVSIGPGKTDSDIITFSYQILTLVPDTSDNTLDQPINLTFTPNPAWQSAITDVLVNGASIAGKYTVSDGSLTVNAGVFPLAGNYSIVAKATGYADAAVTQIIETPVYTVNPVSDPSYIIGATPAGIKTMTVNNNIAGMKYFTVNISSANPHTGDETVVFVQLRSGVQTNLNATRADFDVIHAATAGFNVLAGDVVKAYLVNELTNNINSNPIVFQ